MPADSSVETPKEFNTPERSRFTLLVLTRDAATTAVTEIPIGDDDVTALHFAKQAVAAYEAEWLSLEVGATAGHVAKTQSDELRSNGTMPGLFSFEFKEMRREKPYSWKEKLSWESCDSHGIANQTALARQRLRIAHLLADQQIEPAKGQ